MLSFREDPLSAVRASLTLSFREDSTTRQPMPRARYKLSSKDAPNSQGWHDDFRVVKPSASCS